jgi:hypothetical protein
VVERVPVQGVPRELSVGAARRVTGQRRCHDRERYATLFDAAHQQLGRPLVVAWDKADTHVSVKMRRVIEPCPIPRHLVRR